MKKLFSCCMDPSSSEDVPPPRTLPPPTQMLVTPRVRRPRLIRRQVLGPRPVNFSLKELQLATQGWDVVRVIGTGRTCTVYTGKLRSKQTVAIKRMEIDPNKEGRFLREYKAEKSFLHQLHHENIIELKGFCNESKELILVLELFSKGTVYDRLHDDKDLLGWENRMKIALGTARALDYIHHAIHGPVVHRDIKTTHILIDDKYDAKLIDFGTAIYEPPQQRCKLIVGNDPYSEPMGTDPYIAPEYLRDNKLTTKCDIHCFGVVLLELISGRKPVPEGDMRITDWARIKLIDKATWDTVVPRMIDERIRWSVPQEDMFKTIRLATDCLQSNFSERPEAAQVVSRLLEIPCLALTAPSSSGGGISCLESTIPKNLSHGG